VRAIQRKIPLLRRVGYEPAQPLEAASEGSPQGTMGPILRLRYRRRPSSAKSEERQPAGTPMMTSPCLHRMSHSFDKSVSVAAARVPPLRPVCVQMAPSPSAEQRAVRSTRHRSPDSMCSDTKSTVGTFGCMSARLANGFLSSIFVIRVVVESLARLRRNAFIQSTVNARQESVRSRRVGVLAHRIFSRNSVGGYAHPTSCP
jgi:hypothetical protein